MARLLASCWLICSAATVMAWQDPSLADQLVEEARQLERGDIAKALEMMQIREQEVKAVASEVELARYYNKMAELFSTLGYLNEQQKYSELGLKLVGEEMVAVAADLNYTRGLVYEMKSDYTTARKYYRKGFEIAMTTGHELYQARGKLYLAALFTQEEQYEKALSEMKEAYSWSEQVGDPELTWEVLNELGLLYGYIQDSEQAIEFHLRAVKTAQALQMRELTIVGYYNLASSYQFLGDHETANTYWDKMLVESKASGEPGNLYNAYKGFAFSARAAEQYDRALTYMLKAEEYLHMIGRTVMQVEHHMVKADILGDMEQPNKALEELAIAEQKLPAEFRNPDNVQGLSILYMKAGFTADLGQYQQAYELMAEYNRGARKHRREQNQEAIQKLRITFDSERSETRNSILEKDNEIKALQLKQAESEKQIQTFMLGALALLSLGLIFVMYRQLHARTQLKIIAESDSLTGLYNRRYAFTKGETLVSNCREGSKDLSVVMFDLDHFKAVNDTHGHPAGDEVLKRVSELSTGCLRDSDVMARIGGEEFLVILPGVSREMAEFIAGRLKDKLAACEQNYDGKRFHVTASFGVAAAGSEEDFEQLILRADKALYQAKESGRNCVALAS